MGERYGDNDNYQEILHFYKDILKVRFEPSSEYSRLFGRGYAIFTPLP
jgi:hypothetical protein